MKFPVSGETWHLQMKIDLIQMSMGKYLQDLSLNLSCIIYWQIRKMAALRTLFSDNMIGLIGLVELLLITAAVGYQVLYSFNCGSQASVKTSLLHFDSDQMYEGLSSKSHKKKALPAKYKDIEDIQLFRQERTTDSDIFSYFLPLSGPDHYYLLMKFIEVVHQKPNERVFEVKVGDEVILEIDIVREVGFGEVLNKWIHFQLVDDILYINDTMPVLNGYIYPKQLMRMSLSKIVGLPKIETLTLLKGSDSENFIREHIELESLRLNKKEESATAKYQKDIPLPYKHFTGKEFLEFAENSPTYILTKLFSLDTFLSVVAVVFVILHQKIYDSLNIPREEIKQD